MSEETIPIEIGRWWSATENPEAELLFAQEDGPLPDDLSPFQMVLSSGGEAQAAQLLERGAQRVLFADAALRDSELVRRAVETFGSDRIGVWIPAKRKEISWGLDMVSNADFRCLTPSLGQPGWEVVMSDGTRTGTDVRWWLEKMLERGASLCLLSVDYQDHQDHELSASLAEVAGEKLWISPLAQRGEEWEAEQWCCYGGMGRLVLPESMGFDQQKIEIQEVPA